MYSPIEDNSIIPCRLNQLCYLLSLIFGIGLSPLWHTMIRVVLRSVDINIEFITSVEFKLTKSILKTPWRTIETFNHTTIRYIGIIRDCSLCNLAIAHHLSERLKSIE